MNTFVYNEQGKPEADKGKHDDMIFATGLSSYWFGSGF